MIERRSKMRRIQNYMSNGLMIDYALVMLAFSLGISYLVTEGCVASMLLAKITAVVLVAGLWSMMAHSFLQAKCIAGSIFMMGAVTFFALMNITILMTMEFQNFAIDIEALIVAGLATVLITGILVGVNKVTQHMHHDGHHPQ